MTKLLLISLLFASSETTLVFAQDDLASSTNRVPFAKVMNPAFAKDYQTGSICVLVQFLSPSVASNYIWSTIPQDKINGKVGFQGIPPGSTPPEGLGEVAPHIFIDKSKSDILFELSPGDFILVTGHTVVGESGSFTQTVFIADSVEKKVK